MKRSAVLGLRSAATALAAAACLVGGATSAQADPAGGRTAPSGISRQLAPTEVRTFTGSGMGTSPSQAADGAARMAFSIAQGAGWQANQCHVRATDVRWVGGGVYSAVASLFCQR
ncbi:hypothetical protein [Streptomyces sp. NPDC054863]